MTFSHSKVVLFSAHSKHFPKSDLTLITQSELLWFASQNHLSCLMIFHISLFLSISTWEWWVSRFQLSSPSTIYFISALFFKDKLSTYVLSLIVKVTGHTIYFIFMYFNLSTQLYVTVNHENLNYSFCSKLLFDILLRRPSYT